MMIMAQHPQQQQQIQHQQPTSQQHQQQQPQKQYHGNRVQQQHSQEKQQANEALVLQQQPQIETAVSQQQQYQLELDGKRAIIKNQLYLIEQLQLENANLRNERDQFQLENEELKFQLQMISSSNILLNQPNTAFNDQQLERLVANDGKVTENQHLPASSANVSPAFNDTATTTATKTKTSTTETRNVALTSTTTATNLGNQNHQSLRQQQHHVRLLATPLREAALRQNVESRQMINQAAIAHKERQQQVRSLPLGELTDVSSDAQQVLDIAALASEIVTSSTTPSIPSTNSGCGDKRILSGDGGSKPGALQLSLLTVANSDNSKNNLVPQSRSLPHDDEEQRVKLVEQCYGGDSEQVQAAAIVIQRAFRKYQICKRFRTITEQLRHTYQPSTGGSNERLASSNAKRPAVADRKSSLDNVPYINSSASPDPATRQSAAWESLSYAASRLAASAAGTLAAKQATQQSSENNIKQTKFSQQQQQISSSQQPTVAATLPHQQQHHQPKTMLMDTTRHPKEDPVVAAAINFQQLESIRKRQYRVGLNIFNKSPEKGISFLVAHSFIDSSSPYMKTSTSYYHSNQLHFIDKQQLMHHHQRQTSPINIQNCQLCFEEENLKRNIAHFLLHRKGLAKERIGQYLGNLQSKFNQDVLKYYLQELDFFGLQIDLALRKFLSTFRLPGEAQKIEKIVDCFAQRYVQCQQQQQQQQQIVTNTGNVILLNNNQPHKFQSSQQQPTQQQIPSAQQQPPQTPLQRTPNNQPAAQQNYKNNLILLSKDEIFILTFAIIMLNTDLHSPSLKPTSRMSAQQFVNNLRGVFKSQTINESDLIEIYERVKANQITTAPDHVTHVMKVQQGLTVTNFQKKELPNLCVPYRRLVCFCRLFEVYDVNKKERLGQHQREIFLFNDLLLVTKLARRVRANATQLYTYRQSISLQGLYVQLFQSTHYNFGIRLCQRSNDETIIMFNARNELDQSRFVDDLGESIAEMDEMETIKTNNIIDTIHFKYLDRLQRHTMMHNINDDNNHHHNLSSLTNNQHHHQNQNMREEIHQSNKLSTLKDNDCDTLHTNNNKQILPTLNEQQMNCNSKSSKPTTSIPVFDPNISTNTATSTSAKDDPTNSLATVCAGRVPIKFSSMLNLSSAAIGSSETNYVCDDSNTTSSRRHQIQTKDKTSRHNQLFVNQQSQRVIKQSAGVSMRDEQISATAATSGNQQRRCSTSSVHSLDSGLFLSRDVSPNQSS